MTEADTRNRQILDSAIDYAIIAFDLDGKVTRWNEGAHRVLGWTEEEMLGQDGSRFFTPEDRANDRIHKEMRDALTRGAGSDERWHLRKSGERFWANGEMTPIRGEDGAPIGFVKVLRDRTEQHRSGGALRRSEERLHRAQDAGGVGTFTLELSTDRLYGTRQFYKIFGLPETESVASAVLEALVVGDDAERRSGPVTRGNQAAPLEVEYRIHRANDQALRWIARKAEFERDESGEAIRMVGVVQDITERKAASQALLESAAQFTTFAQALPNHVWTSPANGQLDWFNDRVYEYCGAKPGELDGGRWVKIVHPDEQEAAGQKWAASLLSGALYETEFRIRRADGSYRWHLVRALPLRDSDQQVTRWIGTNTDIHERRLAEAESTRDRNRIWTLSHELMLICDMQGVITAVNPAAKRVLGLSEEQMVGHSLDEFIHADDLAATAAEVGKLATGVTTLAFENRYRTADGAYRLLSWNAVPDGDRIHAVARDITRERGAEEALRQSQKLEAVGQLTGGVAHDFNNLLTVIRTSIDLLRRPELTEDRRKRFMEAISNAVSRATRLTGQLLAFARRQALQPSVFDAGQNARAISEMIGTLAGARIQVELKLDEKPCYVHADPSQFDTSLVNLAVNARDAMSGSGRLAIGVTAVSEIPMVRSHPAVAGPFVAVSVVDTGRGIAAEHLSQIFEPFFTTKGVGEGTGLGLSQVFGFAKQSGGDIHVVSTVDEGSRFTLYLPRAAGPGAASGVVIEADAPVRGDGSCILVVEDNPEVARSVEQTLDALGYRTVLAHSAEAALRALDDDANRFVAVFSDVVMAGMNGIELGQEIRRRHGAMPVVLSSGYSYVLAQSPAHGFALLPKPYSVDDLSRVLHEAVARGRSQPSTRRPPLPADWNSRWPVRPGSSEQERLSELDALRIMDTEEDAAYDELTRLAANFCQTPIALISLVDDKRQWFKSRVGLQATETPREDAFCAHAIQDPNEIMVVTDTMSDERFAANPLVTGDPHIRFYAGAPLVTSSGYALGTICVIDREPRELDSTQLDLLRFLASQVVQQLEARRVELLSGFGRE